MPTFITSKHSQTTVDLNLELVTVMVEDGNRKTTDVFSGSLDQVCKVWDTLSQMQELVWDLEEKQGSLLGQSVELDTIDPDTLITWLKAIGLEEVEDGHSVFWDEVPF